MSVSNFLNAVLPSLGIRFALASLGKQGDPDFRPGQRAFPQGDTDALIGYLATGSQQGRNAYFAVAGFDRFVEPDDEKQRPRRYAHLAQYHRCLRLDVDVGVGKDYLDLRTAVTALLTFVQKYALPKPYIVNSGGGLHVYFPFDRDVSLVEWKGYAARLKAACRDADFRVDGTATEDAARVLRLPGTLNNKTKWAAMGVEPPVVRIIQEGVPSDPAVIVANFPDVVADAIPGMHYAALGPGAMFALPPEMRALVNPRAMGNPHQGYNLRGVLTQCPGMGEMLRSGGADAPEPLWMLALTLINKSDDDDDTKERVSRAVSDKHPAFSEGEFGKKLDQVRKQSYHPPACSKFSAYGMAQCGTCPMRGSISSPIALGYPAPVIADLPSAVAPLQGTPASAPQPVDTPTVALTPTPPSVSAAVAGASTAPPATPMQLPQTVQAGVFVFTAGSSEVRIADGVLTTTLRIVDGYPVALRKAKEEGGQMTPERLMPYKLLAVERMSSKGTDTRAYLRLTIDAHHDGAQHIMLTDDELGEKGKFNTKLRRHSVYLKPRLLTDFHENFMIEFLQQLQRQREATSVATRCGWSTDHASFTLGNTIHHRGGRVETIHGINSESELAAYTTLGNEAVWREAFDIALAGGPDRQLVLALALAGPLMPFTGVDGVLLNAYSPESGVGKSTLCDAALSIWGSPDGLRKDFRDTSNATFKLATVSGNMPLVVDEFTNVEGRQLSDYVYTLTQGREKHRLGADAKLQTPGDRWCLAAIATSNNSVHEKLQAYRQSATAEAARVFELRLHPLKVDPARMGEIKAKLMGLRFNYGFLGPKVAQLFLAKPPEYWQTAVMARIAKWDRESAASTGDRFRSVVCALVEVGASLGLAMGFNFDLAGIEQQLRGHWTKQVVDFERERKHPVDFLNEYLTSNVGNFITMAGPNADQPNVPVNMRQPAGELRNKPGETKFVAHTLIIPTAALRDHVRKTGDWKQFNEWLQASGYLFREGVERLFTATATPVTTACFFFDHAKLSGAGGKLAAVAPTTTTAQEQRA